MDFLEGQSVETKVALLASSYAALSKTVEKIDSKLDDVLAEREQRVGSQKAWSRLWAFLLAVVSGGGSGIMVSLFANPPRLPHP